eukprot:INCI19622.1.p1 GENE.INCI19622.1~~INCI19622.1.p1  ORF type:complete len:413 (+),score=87.18 INCI19622.1:81-1241(+)
MTDSETYAKDIIRVAVCRIAKDRGFKDIDRAALDALADAAAHFIETIGESCAKFASHTGQDGDCSLDHLDTALNMVYRQHHLLPHRFIQTVKNRLESPEAGYEHDILPIPAELDFQQGTGAPLVSTTVRGSSTGSSREPPDSLASRRKILKNVPPHLHNLLPGSFTFKGTKMFAIASNARLARQIAEADAEGAAAVAAAAAASSATAEALGSSEISSRQKKEDYYTAKSKLRTSLNTLWGSTTTFNAQIDRETYEEQRQLQQLQQAGAGAVGSLGGGGMGMPRGRGAGPVFRKRANSSDLSSGFGGLGGGLGRKRTGSIDVPAFSDSPTGAAPEKRSRLMPNPASASASSIASPSVDVDDKHIAPIDSSKMEPEEPPTVLVAENKR